MLPQPEVLQFSWAARPVMLFSHRDILEYVRLYMGDDAEKFIRGLIDDLDSYEAPLSGNTTAFMELQELVNKALDEVEKPRVNKLKIREYLLAIEKEILNQI